MQNDEQHLRDLILTACGGHDDDDRREALKLVRALKRLVDTGATLDTRFLVDLITMGARVPVWQMAEVVGHHIQMMREGTVDVADEG